jgi:hypothetical protein
VKLPPVLGRCHARFAPRRKFWGRRTENAEFRPHQGLPVSSAWKVRPSPVPPAVVAKATEESKVVSCCRAQKPIAASGSKPRFAGLTQSAAAPSSADTAPPGACKRPSWAKTRGVNPKKSRLSMDTPVRPPHDRLCFFMPHCGEGRKVRENKVRRALEVQDLRLSKVEDQRSKVLS